MHERYHAGPARCPVLMTRLYRRSPAALLFVMYCSSVVAVTQISAPPLPRPERSVVAIPPPSCGDGTWAGAPSAFRAGDYIYLSYRLRRPVGQGRGYAVAIARSADGVSFETILTIAKDQVSAESLERPALVRAPGGTWRLYLSCATGQSKHWRIEMIEADDPAAFDPRTSRIVLPGDSATGVKDPVVMHDGQIWHLWAAAHPLADPEEADQMSAWYATSADGLDWTWGGVALSPRPGEWDSRGVRLSAVRLEPDRVVAYYDGRASKHENYEERTGIAVGPAPDALVALGPVAGAPEDLAGGAEAGAVPLRPRGLRYLSIVELGNGQERLYYELTRPDGAHELRTELRPAVSRLRSVPGGRAGLAAGPVLGPRSAGAASDGDAPAEVA
jgi:hypothetical protein